MAEGAPLLREYVGKTCIESSNLSDSARTWKAPKRKFGGFAVSGRVVGRLKLLTEVLGE